MWIVNLFEWQFSKFVFLPFQFKYQFILFSFSLPTSSHTWFEREPICISKFPQGCSYLILRCPSCWLQTSNVSRYESRHVILPWAGQPSSPAAQAVDAVIERMRVCRVTEEQSWCYCGQPWDFWVTWVCSPDYCGSIMRISGAGCL